MTPHYTPLAMALAAALQLAAIAAVPVAWTNSPGMPPYPIKPVPHGSTVDLAVTLKGYTTPPIADGADVRLWYQTNGMGSAWWSAPATYDGSTITATFGPAQDCGADRVSLFFGAPSNVFASAVLRLTHAPGFAPASLPLPVPALDFAAVELRNLSALTNGWSFGSTIGNYEVVSNAAMSAAPAVVIKNYDYWEYLDPNVGEKARLLLMPVGGWGNERFHLHDVTMAGEESYYLYFLTLPAGAEIDSVTTNTRPQSITIGGMTFTHYEGTETNKVLYSDATNGIPSAVSNVVTKSYVEDLGIESGIQSEKDPVWSADKANYATKSEVGEMRGDIEEMRAENAIVYRLYQGSNVVAEVTNYNSAVHAPELRLMQLNESNEYVTVWTETNGLTRTLNAAKEHTDAATNELKNVYAPRAWSRTTSGLGYDAPSNTTWISTPRTVIAGGLEYAKIVDTYGEVWVLTSNGMAMDFNPDTNAYFRITADDGTPVFSIEKSDAQVVGAYAEGITVAANSVTMPVPVVSSEAPTMYWRNQLDSGDWSDQATPPTGATVSWSGSAGSWVCTVTFSGTRPPSMFFKFSFLQPGGVMIRNNATTDLSSGIWVNGTKFVPTVSGNNLIWTKQ